MNTYNHFHHVDIPDEEIFTHCIHCGMCLSVCPTYQFTGLERSSPRGRIRLIKNVAEGSLDISELFVEEMDFCLDCQACQSVCPPGVQFGQLIEAARAQIARAGKDKRFWIKKIFFRWIFISHFRLELLARLLRIYQRYLRPLLIHLKIYSILPNRLRALDSLAPPVSAQFSDQMFPEIVSPAGQIAHRVGFLKGCLMNVMFADVNRDTIDVLLANRCEVVIPKDQVCCGSLAAHNGDFDIARKMARKNIDAFTRYRLDAIVINSAGCSAFMKEYGNLLHDDPIYSEPAKQVSEMTKDIHEFLLEIDFHLPTHKIPRKITYHDACHLAHTQKITREPREILRSIPGIDFAELPESTWCCGSAGIYNLVRYEDSMKILERKVRHILSTKAEILVAANPGCAVQLAYGLRRAGADVQVLNPITLLKQAYGLNNK